MECLPNGAIGVWLLATAMIRSGTEVASTKDQVTRRWRESVRITPAGVTLRPREMLARRLTPPAVHWTAGSYAYLPAFQRFRLPHFSFHHKKTVS